MVQRVSGVLHRDFMSRMQGEGFRMKIRCLEGVKFIRSNFTYVDGHKGFINLVFDRPGDIREVDEEIGKFLAERFPDKIQIVEEDNYAAN